ncbi:MAG TPA: YbhB/YbcL family Raf kinase inhibitor-like protein [Gammaproteobacteria bacterium]
MKLEIDGIRHGGKIPARFAFGKPDADKRVALSDNRNPRVHWSGVPDGTRSLILICVDGDAPSVGDDVNKADREVPAKLKRADFYHWVMVDIPPGMTEIAEGSCSDGVTAHGKDDPLGPDGTRQGLNDYTEWFDGDDDMEGEYFGYDGPCPPWNDSIPHHYHFRLYATILDRCPVDGAFTGKDVERAMEGHVLAETEITGTYTLNPRLQD